LIILLAVGWVLTGVVGALAVATFHDDELWCEHETGDSDFGDASWSWWPLGIECTWTEPTNLVTDHEDSPWGPTVFTALYLTVGAALVSEVRSQRRRRGNSATAT
jgi:hypothetical protein